MKLSEFADRFFMITQKGKPYTLLIFDDEDEAEDFIKDYCCNDNSGCMTGLVGVYRSELPITAIFKQEYCEATVSCFYALDANAVAVVIEMPDIEKGTTQPSC